MSVLDFLFTLPHVTFITHTLHHNTILIIILDIISYLQIYITCNVVQKQKMGYKSESVNRVWHTLMLLVFDIFPSELNSTSVSQHFLF